MSLASAGTSACATLLLVSLSSCGRYADFSLPVLAPAPDVRLHFTMQPAPVLARGEAADVLNPSVIRRGGTLWNFYSEFDGKVWHTALAASTDGVGWAKQSRILSPHPRSWEANYIAANGAAVAFGNEIFYWYQAGPKSSPRIGLARSRDGKNWRKEPQPVLDFGPRGSWDERALGDPYVIRLRDFFYMYYLGQNRARQQRIGLARSHDGIHWEKHRSSPLLDLPWPGSGAMDENGQGEPAVWQSHGWYWMLFTGRDRNENRALSLARSHDGVNWRRDRTVFRGTSSWDSKVVCDPTVLVEGGAVRVWFGGGDVAAPDENIHGQIGYGVMAPL